MIIDIILLKLDDFQSILQVIRSLDSYDSNQTQIRSDSNELGNQLSFQYERDLKINGQEATSPIKSPDQKIYGIKYEHDLNIKGSD